MYNFAPVLIITLNRYEHLKQCIESLNANKYADKTDLFIALDYPLLEQHYEGYRKIVLYTANIKGFKTVNIIKRNFNYGTLRNYFESMAKVFINYDQIIFTEDDNIFSPDFLSFMNKCLETYKDSKDIFSISGYNYPIKMPKSYPFSVYKWLGHSAWGYGVWKEKWNKIDFSEDVVFKNIHSFLNNLSDVIKLNKIASHYIPALFLMLRQNSLHADGYICMYLFINNMYSIFPAISRVRNIGNDGSGINCRVMEYDIYKEQEIYSDSESYELPPELKLNEEINRILNSHWNRSFKSQIKIAAKVLSMKAGFYNPSKQV